MTEEEMRDRLRKRFDPAYLELVDQSHTHTPDQHVEAMKPEERLYHLTITSEAFASLSLLERHRAIYETLRMGTNETLHGITITACTPDEWKER